MTIADVSFLSSLFGLFVCFFYIYLYVQAPSNKKDKCLSYLLSASVTTAIAIVAFLFVSDFGLTEESFVGATNSYRIGVLFSIASTYFAMRSTYCLYKKYVSSY
jgi:hypothetical protein